MQSDRQTEVANIKSSWNQGGYAESWGLCILDNVRFQSKKVSLIGNNKLLAISKHKEKKNILSNSRTGPVPGWDELEGDQTDITKPNPDPVKIKIEGIVYPDRDSSGSITKQLRTKIEELRKICLDADNPKGSGFTTHQLVVPLYKTFYIKIDEYKIETDTTRWGFASFSLDCYIVTKNMDMQGWLFDDNPTKTEIKKEIKNWKEKIRSKVLDKMGGFNNFISTIDQFKSEIEKNIAMATGLINDAKGWVENVIDVANISGIVNEISSTVSSLIYAPYAAAKALINVWENIKGLKNIYTDNKELWKNLYGRSKNSYADPYAKALGQYNQEDDFLNMIDEIIGDEDDTEGNNGNLETKDDINQAKNDIDELFNDLIENYEYTYDDLISLKKLRLMIINYLNNLPVNVTEEFILDQFTPATVASYLRYGNLEHSKNITILNDDNLFLKGVIKSA